MKKHTPDPKEVTRGGVRTFPPSTLPHKILKRLFPCQLGAIEMIEEYLKRPVLDRSALVQMPMGTGKTGVMALCVTQFPQYRKVLIVAPAEYLTQQIEHAITRKFWVDAGLPRPKNLDALRFTPSSLEQQLLSQTDVFICTIQSLQQLHTETDNRLYRKLKDTINLALFDEGHSEPALTWARAIRDLEKKTILFTATPYRNDYRKFKVDSNHIYQFHYDQAESQNIIRSVEPELYPHDLTLKLFAKEIRRLGEKEIRQKTNARILVRCQSAHEISSLVNALNQEEPGCAMGFHTALPETDFQRRKIPPLDSIPVAVHYFIHEKLLLQGVDEKNFVALAVYGRMNNARELIQQIGRVIRNSTRRKETATVLLPDKSPFVRWWTNYLRAEKDPDAWLYQGREFREAFDPREADFVDDLQLTLSARLFEAAERVNLIELLEKVKDELLEYELDELNRFHDTRRNTVAMLYQLHDQISFVQGKVYTESSLGYLLMHKRGDLLFFYDSHGLSPAVLDEDYSRIQHRELQRLFKANGSRITYVDLVNSDVSQRAVRSRSAHAFSIEDSLNNLNDHAHYCRTVRGYSGGEGSFGSRYVGFNRARVSNSAKGGWLRFHEWAEAVASAVASRKRPHQLFGRYAQLVQAPAGPEPTNILLDLDEVREELQTSNQKPVKQIEDVCVDITDGKFRLKIDGLEVPVRISFSDQKHRFELESEELHAGFRVKREEGAGGRPKSLLSYLNQEQSFRVTIRDSDLLYAAGSFFRPRWRVSEIKREEQIPMYNCFTCVPRLAGATSEKGTQSINNHGGWQDDSLFGIIDELTRSGREGFIPLPWLVCDDQNDEVSDFWGIDEDASRLVFIHAKNGKGELSASSLHDICGQVKKNLEFAHRYSTEVPGNLDLWGKRWTPALKLFRKGDYVSTRLRRPGNITSARFWNSAQDLREDPMATIEVWMVIGGGFRFSKYFEEMQKGDPSPQVMQIAYQLQATLDAVSQIGARLRIFCRS